MSHLDLPPLLTVAEVAELDRSSENTVRARITDGTYEHVRIARRILVPRDPLLQRLGLAPPNGDSPGRGTGAVEVESSDGDRGSRREE